MSLAALFAAAEAFAPAATAMRAGSKLALSKAAVAAPQMSMEMTSVEQLTNTLAGVVAWVRQAGHPAQRASHLRCQR